MANPCTPAEAAAHLLNDSANCKAMVVAYIDDQDHVSYFTSGDTLRCTGLADLMVTVMSRITEEMLDERNGEFDDELEDSDDND